MVACRLFAAACLSLSLPSAVRAACPAGFKWDLAHNNVIRQNEGQCEEWDKATQAWKSPCSMAGQHHFAHLPAATPHMLQTATGNPGIEKSFCDFSTTFTSTSTWTYTSTTSTAKASQAIYISFLIEGIDYALLSAQPVVLRALSEVLQSGIMMIEGIGGLEIDVKIFPGSVVVLLRLSGSSQAALAQVAPSFTTAGARLAAYLTQRVNAIPGLQAVATGIVQVRVCGMETVDQLAISSCRAIAALGGAGAGMEMESMPGDVEEAEVIGVEAAQETLLDGFGASAGAALPTERSSRAVAIGLAAAGAVSLAALAALKARKPSQQEPGQEPQEGSALVEEE